VGIKLKNKYLNRILCDRIGTSYDHPFLQKIRYDNKDFLNP